MKKLSLGVPNWDSAEGLVQGSEAAETNARSAGFKPAEDALMPVSLPARHVRDKRCPCCPAGCEVCLQAHAGGGQELRGLAHHGLQAGEDDLQGWAGQERQSGGLARSLGQQNCEPQLCGYRS